MAHRSPMVKHQAGLCAICKHVKVLQAHGNTYFMCSRYIEDSSYRKYPQLPVTSCHGYESRSIEPTVFPTV